MTRWIRKLRCWLGCHEFRVVQKFWYSSRRLKCGFCGDDRLTYDVTGVSVPWSKQLEDAYLEQGYEVEEPAYGEPNGR